MDGNALLWVVHVFARLEGRIPIIVDFGGATGEVGAALLRRGYAIDYTVVENAALVALMAQNTQMHFASEIPPTCDIFFSSGTLQCIPDPYGALELGFSSAKKFVLLKKNWFNQRDVFNVHGSQLFANGPGEIPPGFENVSISYPSRSVNEDRVMEIAARHGFRLISRAPEEGGVIVEGNGSYGIQSVFIKE